MKKMALLTFKGGIHPDDGKSLAKDKAIEEADNAVANKLQEDIDYAMNKGKTLNTEFSAEPVHEYSVTPTTFNDTPDETPDEMPFGESENSSDPFA